MKRFKRHEKLARARELRDAAVALAQHFGVWETASNIKFLSARVATLRISYRTPFQRTPGPGDQLKLLGAVHGLGVPKNMDYGLDVWAQKKVMNVEWNSAGDFVLVSFHPGEWETELMVAARSLAHGIRPTGT
jgi:hypothetical protein